MFICRNKVRELIKQDAIKRYFKNLLFFLIVGYLDDKSLFLMHEIKLFDTWAIRWVPKIFAIFVNPCSNSLIFFIIFHFERSWFPIYSQFVSIMIALVVSILLWLANFIQYFKSSFCYFQKEFVYLWFNVFTSRNVNNFAIGVMQIKNSLNFWNLFY